jgi:AraC family transcriptional regulator
VEAANETDFRRDRFVSLPVSEHLGASIGENLAMTFRPRMQAQIHSYRTLRPLSMRSWPGVVADVWHVHGRAGAGGFYLSPDPRLVVFLGTAPGSLTLRTSQAGEAIAGVSMFYVPPGQPLWSDIHDDEQFAHLDFHLQAGPLVQRLAGLVETSTLSQVVMLGAAAAGPTAQALATMVANEVEHPSRPAMRLDGLLSALLTDVFDLPNERSDHSGGLLPRQLASVRSHFLGAFPRRVSIAELAGLCGLSESWFARAFRRSTGETPQRWMMRLRLEAAQELMVSTNLGLAEIADATGFADQAHLTRVFRDAQGLPPSQWRRLRQVGNDG